MSADEFQICMNILTGTKLSTTAKGQGELVALIIEQAELNSEEEPIIIEDEHVERYILCATHALPFFSVGFFTVLILTNIDKCWLIFYRSKSHQRHLLSMLVRSYFRCTHGN